MEKWIKLLLRERNKTLVFIFILGVIFFCGLLLSLILSLPNVETIKAYTPPQTTTIYSLNGKEVARLHREENRITVPLSKISPYLIMCVIANEDERFYQHHGIDFQGIARATLKNLLRLRFSEGGSTITQQLARSLFLTRRKKLVRKITEILLALEIEKKYTKQEILELYLNQVYWGHNAYGIESAARLYFNKSAADLDLAQSALLAGLLGSPEYNSPYRNLKRAKNSQALILNKLVKQHKISSSQEEEAKTEAKSFKFPRKRLKRSGYIAPYFISYILQDLIKRFGEESVYKDGYRVYTTLDTRLQTSAEAIVDKFVSKEGTRYNFSQVALVSIDPRTGYIKAMVGGVDFNESMFNRAVQAKRQPGSSFKPFIYTVAMQQGFSPGFVLKDEPVTFEVPTTDTNPEGKWEPKNFNKKFNGEVTIREALVRSLNIPSIKLLEKVGVGPTIRLARKMGIESPLEPSYALALGVSEVTLLELTSAYGTFANAGVWVKPSSIIKIEDQEGNLLYQNKIQERRAMSANISAAMINLMKDVIESKKGTGRRARLDREAAAKSGTTEEFRDAWFIGYVPQLVTGVWVGNDDNQSMQGVAEVSICPRIWKAFMKEALKEEPVQSFPKPKGWVKVKFCLDSGLLPNPACPKERIREDYFWEKSKPKKKCDFHPEKKEAEPQKLYHDEIPMEEIELND